MIINRQTLLRVAPIKNMLSTKETANGVTYGMSEAGYDIRIKQNIKFLPKKNIVTRVELTEDTGDYYAQEGNFVLASAMEEFNMPGNLVGIVHDKSTWARRGLSVFNTVIEPGWKGWLTLELVYHGKDELIIPAGSGIAQVIFHTITDHASYAGRYQHQENKPVPSKEAQ